MDKLERRDIFIGSFWKYNNLKSKTHVYNTYKNKLHHTIGAETIRKKEQIQIGAMQAFFMSSFMFLIKFYNSTILFNINWMLSKFFMSSYCDDKLDSTSQKYYLL